MRFAVILLSLLFPIQALAWSHASTAPPPLAGISFGNPVPSPFRYNTNYPTKYGEGDTYYNTWADDNNIYTTQGDVPPNKWWQGTGNVFGSNIAISTFNGFTTALTATGVNDLTASFGGMAQTDPTDTFDWKPCGIISVGGTLYMSVSRIQQGSAGNGFVATYQNSQIVKSTDHGANWSPLPPGQALKYASPMFPNHNFDCGTPIQYGQDYQGQTADNSNVYVYWLLAQHGGDGQTIRLARVKIVDLPALDATKYQWYKGGDGMLDASWSSLPADQITVASDGTVGNSGLGQVCTAQYIMGRYIIMGSRQTTPDHPAPLTGQTADTATNIFEAPHPWGPYTQIGYMQWNTGHVAPGLYCPAVIPKSVSGATGTTAFSGDFNSADPQFGAYTLWIVPITVNN